ncbi:hypothetical protein K7I13_02620 [Brucepastera parasyntrophica]|uniref:nitroreductase family protein n=1 Tax=Brucepastera parasyntrophica TaxID=2880008 RepID=UPI00210E788B|nr:nitroreductase family protein [Brucepastera parasyntrophica]ULQ60224.1 hypothetical protein K7I13_02620 [Brucepastera parasyntrophica]
MNDIEAVNVRQSRRTYLALPIAESKASYMKKILAEYNGQSGLNMEYLEDGSDAFNGFGKSYGMFKGVRTLIVIKGPSDDGNLKEKSGHYGEKAVLEATKLDLGTCWVGGTFERENPVFVLSGGEELVCVITAGNVPDSYSLKERFFYGVSRRRTKEIGEMYRSDSEPPEWFISAMHAVQKAPSAKNTQKVFFEYSGGTVRAGVPDDYRFDLVDLGIAKLHFELAAGGYFDMGNNAVFHKT